MDSYVWYHSRRSLSVFCSAVIAQKIGRVNCECSIGNSSLVRLYSMDDDQNKIKEKTWLRDVWRGLWCRRSAFESQLVLRALRRYVCVAFHVSVVFQINWRRSFRRSVPRGLHKIGHNGRNESSDKGEWNDSYSLKPYNR